MKYSCFHCGNRVEIPKEFARREECPSCGWDVQCCKNCEFFDVSSYNECREPSAEVEKEKERANYCDYFSLSSAHKGASAEKEELLSAAEALFKK
ncbi:MAG: hypothetical protein HOO06_10040 [Bdellovibrionaceae bacterium]|jgi:hypothetical protein|nr:hypothetical protein [Pseudobdellovibrionaceae bacterium]